MIEKNSIINFAKLYTDVVDDFAEKSGGHNSIYIIKGNKNFALRVTPVYHRNLEEIKSEIDFMLYLHSHGVPLTKPIQGITGGYCYECYANDKICIISAFEIGVGIECYERIYTPEIMYAEGKTLGKIHRFSKNYTPIGVQPRRQWNQNSNLINAYEVFKDYNKQLFDIFEIHIENIRNLPKNKDSFGMIHGDYALMNYFTDGNNLTVFDFDECEYSWFISDIAGWFVRLMLGGQQPANLNSRIEEATKCFSYFMQGYLTENIIRADQFKNIDLFFKIYEYTWLSYNLKRRGDGFDEWTQELVNGILDRILNERMFINVDFVSIYNQIL